MRMTAYGYSYWQTLFGSTVLWLFSLAFFAVVIVAQWKTFEKAGEHGWASLIPFYNAYVLFRITWGSGWMFLVLLVPLAGLVFHILTMVRLAKAFGRSGGFAVGLLFLSAVFYCILGFGSAQYEGVPE